MARFGGMTALRAALGGVAGGLEGLGAMREAQRLEQEQARALERQSMMDEIMLRDKRFRPSEELAAARQPSGEALSRALSSATAMMRPGGMAGGAAPSLQAGDTGLVQQARSLAAPRERVTMGGRAFEREEAESYRTRMAGEEAAQARMAKEQQAAETRQAQEAEVQALMAAGIPEVRARAAVRSGAKYGDVFMTPGEQSRERLGLAQLGVEREKAQKTEAGKPRFGEVSSLRKEFNTETRPYKTINDALKNIEALGAKRNPTPQDDQALIYQFVKAQDPTSVVRESEYANAQSAIALTDRITSYAQRLQTGQKLTPTQRADMVRTARLLRQEAMSQYRSLADSYEALATSFGMDPKTIVANRLDRGFDAAQAAAKLSAADALAKLRGGK